MGGLYAEANMTQRTCQTCGKVGIPKPHKFCCRLCYDNSRRKRLKCTLCGKEFWRENGKRLAQRPFCSQECRDQWGDKRPIKRCPRCGQNKPHATFKRWYCVDCSPIAEKAHKSKPSVRFANGKAAARQHQREWTITLDEFSALIQLPCHYCARPLETTGRGMDRKDTAKGYTLDNVVPCCKRCNGVKMDHFTYAEMVHLSPTIREIDKART